MGVTHTIKGDITDSSQSIIITKTMYIKGLQTPHTVELILIGNTPIYKLVYSLLYGDYYKLNSESSKRTCTHWFRALCSSQECSAVLSGAKGGSAVNGEERSIIAYNVTTCTVHTCTCAS